jgi:hypothetical protein
MFVMVAVAALVSVFALTAFAGGVGAEKVGAGTERAIPPEGCPPGWEQATHPLNPQLGCLPTHEQADGGFEESDPNPGDCPEGFVRATHPLNPALGCIADTFSANVAGELHPDHCPEGWVLAESPLNRELGCIADTLETP